MAEKGHLSRVTCWRSSSRDMLAKLIHVMVLRLPFLDTQFLLYIIERRIFEDTPSSPNDRNMRSPLLFGILVISLSQNATANIAQDPKTGLAL